LDPAHNPVVIPPAPDNIVRNGYTGTTRTQALNWVFTLQQLGQVDPTVTADVPEYAVFIKDGRRSFVAFNPGSSPIQATFQHAQGGAVLAVLTVQPGQTVTQLASDQLIDDGLGQAKAAGTGANLYLMSSGGQNTLASTPGTAVPANNGNPL